MLHHIFHDGCALTDRDGCSFKWKETISLEIPHCSTRYTFGEARGIDLCKQFFQHLCRLFECNRLSSITLIGFKIDIIESDTNQASSFNCNTRQRLRTHAIHSQRFNLFGWSTKVAELIKHISHPSQHGNRAIIILENTFKIDDKMANGFSKLVFQSLLNRPSSQSSHSTSGLRNLSFKERHDFTTQQMTRCCSNVINRRLNNLQCSLNCTIQEDNRVTERSSMLKTFKDRTKASKCRIIIEQCLCKRFFSESSTKPFSFCNIGNGFLVRITQRFSTSNKSREFGFCISTTSTKIAEFGQ